MKYEISLSDAMFHEKVIRDLRSLITDPLILASSSALELQHVMHERVTRFIETEPERLSRMVQRPDPKLPLGKWFENIFLVALRITFPFSQVHHSVKDWHGGELDFVITGNHNTVHIECAVKFFLHHLALGFGLNSYLGPAGNDRLDLKYRKMFDVQLKRNIPQSLDVKGPVTKILWMGGRIHEPLETGFQSALSPIDQAPPSPMNPSQLKGYWGTTKQLLASLHRHEIIYKLPRQWRMTALDGLKCSDLAVFKTLSSDEFLEESIMTARVAVDGEFAVERGRGFVSSIEPAV
jgi:hypothetical protein